MNTNPITAIRKLEGKSLDKFADLINIHYQAVYLNECGVYPTVLPVIADWLSKQGYDKLELEREYQEFVKTKRQENGLKYGLPEITDLGPPTRENPFILFREQVGLTRSQFCKSFCVHPASVRQLELGVQHTLPSQLHTALIHAGMDPLLVTELEERLAERTFSLIKKVS